MQVYKLAKKRMG